MPLNQTYDSKQNHKQQELLLYHKFQTLFFGDTDLQGRWMPGDAIVQYLNGYDEDNNNNNGSTRTSTRAFNAMINKKCPLTNGDYYVFPTGGSLYNYYKEVKKSNGKKGKVRFYFIKTKGGPDPTTPNCWTEIYQQYLDLDLDDDDESRSTGNKKKRTRTRTRTPTTTTTTITITNTNSSSKKC